MAKIRGIKPEFWTDEDIVELSRDARLLFIGMWNFACDNGHLADSPRQIKMRVLPADDVDVDALLEELVQRGRIVRDGTTITIPKFAHHQKPHKRWWSTCDLPGCTLPDGAGQPERHRGTTVAHREPTSGTTADGDGDGDGDGELMAKPAGKPRRKPARAIPEDWKPTENHQKYANERSLDLSSEAFRFRNHAMQVDRRCANWNAAFTNWLSKAKPAPRAAANGDNYWSNW